MAKPIGGQAVPQMSQLNLETPGIAVTPVTLWSPPAGIDYLNVPSRLSPQHASEIINLWLDRGVLRTRSGTVTFGTFAAPQTPVMAVINFITASGVGFLLRFTTRSMEQYNNGIWTNIGGTPFTGDTTNQFTFVAWANTLLVSNGVNGIYEYSATVGTFTAIAGAPSAKYLSTFAGRVLASGIPGNPSAIQWSVKNDSHDWTGTGSGIEQLLSTPGGLVDEQMGVHPINDTIALAARSNSIWQMTQTGDPDAPFRFARLYTNLGTHSPRSIDVFPGGIFMVGNDNIYIINEREFKPIGDLVKDRLGSSPELFSGRFVPDTQEYRVSTGSTDVFRYSLRDQGWTLNRYPFEIRSMAITLDSKSGIQIDELTATIDNLTGAIENLSGSVVGAFVAFATGSTVVREVDGSTTDSYRQTGLTTQGWSIRTGTLIAGTPLEKTEVKELQLEYQFVGQPRNPLVIRYSVDGGRNWDDYSTPGTSTPTLETKIRSARKAIQGRNIQFEISSDGLDIFQLNSLTVFMIKGARIHP